MRAEELQCDKSKSYHSDDTCYPLDTFSNQDWTLSQIFGHSMKGSCPLTEDGSESVCIGVPDSRDIYTSSGVKERKDSTGYHRCYQVPANTDFEMVLAPQGAIESAPVEQPPLYAERSFIGHGQERGGVQAILTNPSLTNAVDFVYMESLPWFMKLYLHTLKAKITHGNDTEDKVIQEMYYRPALDSKRGTQLEIHLRIPANSTTVLTYDFEKAILRYTEYPPDANRGFDVASAIITIGNVSIRTTSLLLPLPTPDFSMPYNVIILTSTVMALAFGTIFNRLVRRFVGANEADKWDVRALRTKVLTRAKLVGSRVVVIFSRLPWIPWGKSQKTEKME